MTKFFVICRIIHVEVCVVSEDDQALFSDNIIVLQTILIKNKNAIYLADIKSERGNLADVQNLKETVQNLKEIAL